MPNLKRNSKVNECKQYKLDLSDYATGEMTFLTKEKQRRLFDHLRKCTSCREMFFDYENIYSLLVTTGHVQKPEFIDRMNRLKEQFKSSAQAKPAPTPACPAGAVGRDIKVEINSAAEAIYKFVKDYTGGSSDKKVAIPVIRKETGLVDYPFYEAMSWLVMNDKTIYTKDQDNRPAYVSPR